MAGGNAIRGSRVGAGPMGEAERGEAAPRHRIPYWCANGHETRIAFADDADVPERGTAPAAASRPGRTRRTRRRPRAPSRTRPTWPTCGSGAPTPTATPSWPRRSPACAPAAGPDARPSRSRRQRCGSRAAAASSSSQSVRPGPCTPGRRQLRRPAPDSARATALGLVLAGDDQPHLVGRVDRGEAQGDPGRRRLRAVAHGDDRARRRRRAGSRGRSRRRGRPGPTPSSSTSKRGHGAVVRPAAAASSAAYAGGGVLGSSPSAPSEAGIGCTRAGSSGRRRAAPSRAWVSLRSGSPAGRNRSSPHQTSTADQSTASRPARRPARRRAPGRRRRWPAGEHQRRRSRARLGLGQPGDQPRPRRPGPAGRRRARRRRLARGGLARPDAAGGVARLEALEPAWAAAVP